MPLPEGMEGSRDARDSLAHPPQPAQGSLSGPAATLPPPPPPPPLRPDEPQRGRPCPPGSLPTLSLLGLALLQLVLGSALVGLSFATLWLNSDRSMKNACSAWAGSLAMLCGILALMTYKRSAILSNGLLVLLSLLCVPLSLIGFILGCQSTEFVSRAPRCNLMDKENKICFCCEELNINKCTEVEMVLKLYHVKSCNSAHLLLKNILLVISVLNALIAAVCLTEVALYCWQIPVSRRSCPGELQAEDQDHSTDPDGFVPPASPPLYFVTYHSGPPQTSHRTPLSDGLSLSSVYAMQTNSAEVFFRVDPPPPYEEVDSLNASEQGESRQINVVDSAEEGEGQDSQAEEICESYSTATPYLSDASWMTEGVIRSNLGALQTDSTFIIQEECGSWRALRNERPDTTDKDQVAERNI